MAKTKAPNPNDVLRLGSQVATIKANMPRKRWVKFVKVAHSRGHTVGGELSDVPSALKERTQSSLQKEAASTVAKAYAPATKALSTRQASISYLDQKRKTDDAAYRTWLNGQTGLLNSQASAADATLAAQQTQIASDTKTAIAAARADSLARAAATPGNVSNPAQSTALDTSAADTASTQRIAAARDQTAAISKIGTDSRTLASASILAAQGAREASRQADTWKSLSDLNTDRQTLATTMSGAAADKLAALRDQQVTIAQNNRDNELASASLGLKQDTLAQSISDADRKYKLASAKYGLDKWKAGNADIVARAKVDLGYDQIKSREGTAAAQRKLDAKLTKIRVDATTKATKAKKAGVTSEERDTYRAVQTVSGLFTRWDKNNRVPLDQREQHLRDMGYDDVTIQVAHDLARNHGKLSAAGRAAARKLGIKHVGYFFTSAATAPSAADVNAATGAR